MNETTKQLFDFIEANVTTSTPVIVDTVTDAKLKKKDEDGTPCPYVNIKKHQRKHGTIGFDYRASVDEKRTTDGSASPSEYAPHKRAWGTLSDNRLWVNHKDNVYLQVSVDRFENTQYFNDQNEEIDEMLLRPFLTEDRVSPTGIVINDIKIENIKKIVLNPVVDVVGRFCT